MAIVAVIPARGGSKGVPRKNVRLIRGKPLIAYSIEAALAVRSLDRLIVSTDDPEIAEVAKSFGAEVPFVRPAELSGDQVADRPVLLHALKWLEETTGLTVDLLVHLRATTPMKTSGDIEDVVRTWRKTGSDVIRSVSTVPPKYHPYWSFKLTGSAAAPFVDGLDPSAYFQRQLLPPVYHLNGLVDAYSARYLKDPGSPLVASRFEAVVTPEERSLDIDTESDLKEFESRLENES